jgi:hypothetical protein
MLQKLINSILGQRAENQQTDLYRELKRREARIGGEVFGPVPSGHRREFFCLDRHTWIWHEEWRDNKGQTQVTTTRYEVRPDGILKAQHGAYHRVSDSEAHRLRQAAELYLKRIKREIYANVA